MNLLKSPIFLRLYKDPNSDKVFFVEVEEDFIQFLAKYIDMTVSQVSYVLSSGRGGCNLQNLIRSLKLIRTASSGSCPGPDRSPDRTSDLSSLRFIKTASPGSYPGPDITGLRGLFLPSSSSYPVLIEGSSMKTTSDFPALMEEKSQKTPLGVPTLNEQNRDKDRQRYLVTDDLTVEKLHVADMYHYIPSSITHWEVVVIQFGNQEAREFLAAALTSKTLFTDMFTSSKKKRKLI